MFEYEPNLGCPELGGFLIQRDWGPPEAFHLIHEVGHLVIMPPSGFPYWPAHDQVDFFRWKLETTNIEALVNGSDNNPDNFHLSHSCTLYQHPSGLTSAHFDFPKIEPITPTIFQAAQDFSSLAHVNLDEIHDTVERMMDQDRRRRENEERLRESIDRMGQDVQLGSEEWVDKFLRKHAQPIASYFSETPQFQLPEVHIETPPLFAPENQPWMTPLETPSMVGTTLLGRPSRQRSASKTWEQTCLNRWWEAVSSGADEDEVNRLYDQWMNA